MDHGIADCYAAIRVGGNSPGVLWAFSIFEHQSKSGRSYMVGVAGWTAFLFLLKR